LATEQPAETETASPQKGKKMRRVGLIEAVLTEGRQAWIKVITSEQLKNVEMAVLTINQPEKR